MQRAPVTEIALHREGWSTDEPASDRSLVQRIAAGDRDALADLYAAHQRPLFRYLCQLTPDRGLAEEILQDTLVAIWQGAASFEGRSAVRTWLFAIARRQAHNTLRRRALPLADAEALVDVADPEPLPQERALAHAEFAELARGIAALQPIHREVLVLSLVNGLPYHEIARIVDVPEGTVKSRLSNARRALRALLRG